MVAERVGKEAWLTIAEVREQFDELIARVDDGETVVILDKGRVAARLIPGNEPKHDPDARKEAWRKFREEIEERRKNHPTGLTLEEILELRHAR